MLRRRPVLNIGKYTRWCKIENRVLPVALFQISRPTPRATALRPFSLGSSLFLLFPRLARWWVASALACVSEVGDGGSEGAADWISSDPVSEDVDPRS